MKTVLFSAPVLTQSGYGVHSQQVAQYLLNLEKRGKIKLIVQAVPWGDTPWHVNPDNKNGLVGEIMKHTTPIRGDEKIDVSIQLKLPNEWNPTLGAFNVGITAGVETDRCNPEWVAACNKMQMLVVPSNHTLQTIKNSGNLFTTKVHVVPEAFPSAFLNNEVQNIDLGLETNFNFLVFGQLTGNNPENDRKNIFYTLKWLCESFQSESDVGIVVKTNGGKNTKMDRNVIKNVFTTLVNEIKPNGKGPKIYLVHGDMNDVEIYSMLKNPLIKCLVSLTRGEGFGLPLLEAAACGLPVVATNWSAHTEFLNLGKYISVDSKLTEIHSSRVDNNIFVQGAKWAQPSEECFKRKIKKLHANYDAPKRWAAELQTKIVENYKLEAIFAKYDDVFKGILW